MFKKFKIVLLFAFVVLTSGTAKSEYNCIFEHLSTEDGLSHGSVPAMLKDQRGFMWFATINGLNRFDGHTFKIFKPKLVSDSISASNRIDNIKEDAFGNIWAITYDAKVFRLDRYTDKLEFIICDTSIDPLESTTNIFTSKEGDVWISTKNSGVYQIVSDTITNKINTTYFNTKSKLKLPGDKIILITEDQEKNIWINTDKGVVVFERSKGLNQLSIKTFSKKATQLLKSHTITSIRAINSLIYLGTNEGQLLVYNNAKHELDEIVFSNETAITNLSFSKKGTLYLGTNGNGIFEYNLWTDKISNHYFHPTFKTVLKTFVDSRGALWVESTKIGITRIDTQTGQHKHFEQALDIKPDIRPVAQCGLHEDEQQTVWLTLKGGGFGYYNNQTNTIEYFYNKPGDPNRKTSNYIRCFYKDPSGVLWMSTYFKGIEKITFIDNKFHFVQPASQSILSIENEIRALLEDSNGFLWAASKKQELFILDKEYKPIKKFNSFNGKAIGNIYAFLEDSQGNIYAGTKGNGLFKITVSDSLEFDITHFSHDPENPSSLSNNNIYSIIEDHQGAIWIGTYGGGVNILVNNQFLNTKNGLLKYPNNTGQKVRHINQDDKGNIWIGTTNGILFVKPQEVLPNQYKFESFNQENGMTSNMIGNDVFWIFTDRKGTNWFATLGGGLAKLNNYPGDNQALEFNILSKKNGLSSDVIFTITEDENDNLWMSTENGITFYNPGKQTIRNYRSYDGILKSVFSEAAITKRSDGSICMGANNGIYSFFPNDFYNEKKKINIVFTEFQLFGKEITPSNSPILPLSISESKSIKLQHNQNVFGIRWSALEYKMQNILQFEYKLEGYDSKWQHTGNQNQAKYTKVPPGDYILKVRFSNPELKEINPVKSINIEILPPIWRTTWAYIIYLILAISLVEFARRIITSIISLRNKVVIEKELTNLKLNFFTNISHELRTPLSLILGPIKELRANEELSEKGEAYSKLIDHNAKRLLRLVNQLLDFRKVQSSKMSLSTKEVNLVLFVKEACKNFEELAIEKNIHFKVETTVDAIYVRIDEEKMDSVIYNLLSNAFKFTPSDGSIEVNIKAQTKQHTATLEVIDSGIGITKEQEKSLFELFSSSQNTSNSKNQGTGIGLALSKELVKLHNGELTFKPNSGKGSIFCIKLDTISQRTNQIIPKHTSNIIPNQQDQFDSVSAVLPRILIVEDNAELRAFLNLQMSNNYLIDEAENGKEGYLLAINKQPDIILSDIMMPEMDGIELLDKIKNNFETSHIPVVLLSAKSSIESKIEGLKYGADAYLTKPFESEQLKAQINNLLKQRILLRESFSNTNNKTSLLITNNDTLFLNQVRDIIEENLANTNFKIKDIYSKLGMGRSKFSDKIKGLTGLPPIDFIKDFRLSKAQRLLTSGKYNVSETSFMSGFTDSGYFSKCYKERFGISPSQVEKKKD